MEAVSTIFSERIRTLVLPLSAEQRLELIQDIASLAPVVGVFPRNIRGGVNSLPPNKHLGTHCLWQRERSIAISMWQSRTDK